MTSSSVRAAITACRVDRPFPHGVAAPAAVMLTTAAVAGGGVEGRAMASSRRRSGTRRTSPDGVITSHGTSAFRTMAIVLNAVTALARELGVEPRL